MKTGKLIIYNIITFFTMINIAYLFFGSGLIAFSLSKQYLKTIIIPFLLITTLVIVNFMVNYSYIKTKAITKKNLLRVSTIILSILAVGSIITRIIEIVRDNHTSLVLWLNTAFYIILLITAIMILKDLYKLIEELFKKKY